MDGMRWQVIESPIGDLGVALDDTGLCAVHFAGHAGPLGENQDFSAVRAQLTEYFAGLRTEFDLALSVTSGTDFERAVWREIATIPYGEMRTYGQIARDVGESEAARAVGAACHVNPLPIVVPCHRVVGAGNKLIGFG